ncbi:MULTISPECIES: hypothetical protein [Mammaliicoccus]|uniref:hypothetical protein n=1 Tax=Mammaliicoccus TaxID=2803850 RepID=UPI000D1CEC7E|nr:MULTISPECIES: hypothetical protein [Mammaliicoccus]MEB6196563.1 hypothetical protein [Mammaliicoccus sciuri]PTE34587.1 hypothetical protein BUY94_03365 [Mammaliicoccus fleurettii]
MIKLNDFLNAEALGNDFVAVKGYTEVLHHETGKLDAYKLNISIQDDESPFFMEMINIKVKNLNPTLSVNDLKNNKTIPVVLKDLQIGQFNGNLWFSCTDVLSKTK